MPADSAADANRRFTELRCDGVARRKIGVQNVAFPLGRKMKNLHPVALLVALLIGLLPAGLQADYAATARGVREADFTRRAVPRLPAPDQRIRVIIDTDAANEIDDQWAMALALLAPERFEILGFVAANFDNPARGGPGSIENSYREIQRVLAHAGMADRFPVLRGSPPMQYQYAPSKSEGVDFIIGQARASTPEDPLWVIALGSATNLASAWLQAPDIADRVVYFWHGRTRWPEKLWNFNVFGDRHAAIMLFHAPVPLVLFDTGGQLTLSMEETVARVKPHGTLGRYLHDIRTAFPWFSAPGKGFFDLGDIAVLVDPNLGRWEEVECPEVDPDLSYRFTGKRGRILRCHDVDRAAVFELLFQRLENAANNASPGN